jgi:hypothetical protein
MTDTELLILIRGNAAYKTLADAGSDNALAEAITAALPVSVPITVTSLAGAAPQTLASIAGGSNPLSEMEVIASRIRDGDAAGIGSWAATLALIGKMSATEHTAVEELVTAATVSSSVNHDQVSRVLAPLRPTVDGALRANPINWS